MQICSLFHSFFHLPITSVQSFPQLSHLLFISLLFCPSIVHPSDNPWNCPFVHVSLLQWFSWISPFPPVPSFPLFGASTTERHGAAMGGLPVSQSEEGVSSDCARLSAILTAKILRPFLPYSVQRIQMLLSVSSQCLWKCLSKGSNPKYSTSVFSAGCYMRKEDDCFCP